MTSALRDLWNLDDEVAFLNHGSFGATPKSVLAAQARLRDQLEQEPVRFFERYLPGALAAAREAVAAWVGGDPAGLAFVPNASTGVATVLANLRLEPGDELLVTNHAYGACRNAFALTAERAGAVLVTAEIPFPGTTEDTIVAAVLAAVTSRTKLALIDHVTSPTGLVFPLERLLPEFAARTCWSTRLTHRACWQSTSTGSPRSARPTTPRTGTSGRAHRRALPSCGFVPTGATAFIRSSSRMV